MHRGFGLLLALRDDADEVADDHQPDEARQLVDRRFVDAEQRPADEVARVQPGVGRPHHATVQHAGTAHVVHIDRLSGDLGPQVDPRRRLADQRVVGHRLGRRRQVQQQLGMPVGQQRGIGQAPAIGSDHLAGPGAQRGRRQACACAHVHVHVHAHVHVRTFAPARRGCGHQPGPRLRRCQAQRLGMQLDRGAGNGRALVGGAGGVTQQHLHLVQRQVEFLGDDLAIGGADAGAQVDMAGQHHRADDALPFVDQRQQHLQPLGRVAGHHRRLAGRGRRRRRRIAQHQQHAGGVAKMPAGVPVRSPVSHGQAGPEETSSAINTTARCTAARISRCVPQRHRLCDSAARACASVACGRRRSSATVVITMPLRQ